MFYRLLTILQPDSDEINPSRELIDYRNYRDGVLMLAAGSLLVSIISLISCAQLNKESNWIKQDAKVVTSVVESTPKGGPRLKITYRYQVGNKAITATETQLDFAINSEKGLEKRERIQKEKNRLDTEKTVPVLYNPSSPTESRIVNNDPNGLLAFLEGLAGVSVLILFASVWALYSLRRPNTMPSVKEHAQAADAKSAKHKRAIVDSLRDRRTVVDPHIGSVTPESLPLDNTSAGHTPDGTTINVKRAEKETL